MPTFLDAAPIATAPPSSTSSSPPRSSGGGTFLDQMAAASDESGATNALAQGMTRLAVPGVISALDRLRQTTQSGIAGHNWLGTLLHGADQHEQDRNRQAVREKLGITEAHRAHEAPLERGATDFAVDTVTDPMTLLGAPLFRLAGKAAKPLVEMARNTPLGRVLEDATTFGGSAKRELGADRYHAALAAENRQAAREAEGGRRLLARYDAAIGKLSPAEKQAVFQVLNGERDTRGMPQHLVDAVRAAKQLRNDAGALWANESGRLKLAYGGGRLAQKAVRFGVQGPPASRATDPLHDAVARLQGLAERPPRSSTNRRLVGRVERPYVLPDDLREFAAPADQGILGAGNVRADYLPAPHGDAAALVDPNAGARTFNLLQPFAPHALERDRFQVGEKDVGALDEAFRGMLSQAARQGTAGRLRSEVGVAKGGNADPALIRLFERETPARGAARSDPQKIAEGWRGLVDIPKNTVTTIGLKHGLVNVPALALLSEGPGAALEGAWGGLRQLARSPEARYEALRGGVETGVISPSAARENPIVDLLGRIPVAGGALGRASRAANDLTWAIDDATKQAVARRKYLRFRRAGLSDREARDRAAAETMREMIDYRHRSDFTKALGNVAPFATFRSRLPAAVASSVSRDPKKLLALDRATGGISSTGGADADGHNVSLTTPISDVVQLATEPQRYARSTMTDPLRALLGAAAIALPSRNLHAGAWKTRDRYFTYGQPVLPHVKDGKLKAGFLLQQLAGDVPFGLGEAALGASGVSEWPALSWPDLLLGPTLGVHVR